MSDSFIAFSRHRFNRACFSRNRLHCVGEEYELDKELSLSLVYVCFQNEGCLSPLRRHVFSCRQEQILGQRQQTDEKLTDSYSIANRKLADFNGEIQWREINATTIGELSIRVYVYRHASAYAVDGRLVNSVAAKMTSNISHCRSSV